MADSTCLSCYGSGFDVKGLICVNHLKEAYEEAIRRKDVEMAAACLWKERQMRGQK